MKKITLVIILALVIQFSASSQSCLSQGINFSTQAMIDDFQTNFPNCTVIEGDVRILGNDITNLDGLSNIISINGHFDIWMNPSLTNLLGLSSLTYIGDFLFIKDNPILGSFTGLNNLITIDGSLGVEMNTQITSFEGFESLTTIGGYFDITLNENLQNFSGLDNLNSIGDDLSINANNSLVSLIGLESLSSSVTHIMLGWNTLLTDLTTLQNITSISVTLSITHNDVLADLSGLENINLDAMQYLYIKENPLLSTCEIQNICNYLSSSTGTIEITENAVGCNTQGEVEAACILSLPDLNIEPEFILYPNPAKKELFILCEKESTLDKVVIYNQLGQEVFQTTNGKAKIDISNIGIGIYIIEMIYGKLKIRDKLIIEE